MKLRSCQIGSLRMQISRFAWYQRKDLRGAWWLSFDFDGDDEPGDPSGIHMVAAGFRLEAYWPMHRHITLLWSLDEPSRLVVGRW